MRAIDRKLLRNLWTLRSQAMAIALVIACGIAMAVMSLSALRSLHTTQQTYYDRYRFADVFTSLKRAPLSVVQRMERIPGVATVDPRIVERVNLIVPNMPEPAVGQLISIPNRGEPALNHIYLRQGRMPEVHTRIEVVVSESFAEAHGFQPGDAVQAIMNGRLRDLNIVGIALSPEHVIQVDGVNIFPDFKRFGLFWVPQDTMEAAFDMDGAFNDVTLSLMSGASESEVIRQVDLLTDEWGGVGAFGRDDQMSHRFLSDEITQLRAMGFVTPIIFMLVAGFLLNMVMTRVIAMQRVQIAALKAFGYSNYEVAMHFGKLVGAIVLIGIVLGVVAGVWMGRGLTSMYTAFYKFPIFHFELDIASTVLTSAFSLLAGFLATGRALYAAAKLPPAEAMRPAPPGIFRTSLLERLGLLNWLPQTGRMIVRQLRRRPVKALFSVCGIASAVAVLVVGNYATDALEFLVDFQFRTAQQQDLSVTLSEPTSPDVMSDFRRLPGVTRTESFRSLAVRMRHGPRSRQLAIMGMDPERQLFRIIDADFREPALTNDGLVISTALARLLAVNVGDDVTVEVMEGKRPVSTVRIVGTIEDYSGTNAYALRPFVNQIAEEGPMVSGVWMAVDARSIDSLYTQLKNTPRVVGVNSKEATIQGFQETVAENQLQLQAFVIVFASIIAAGVVYNTARIILSERDRELATLRVIGFTRAEVSTILLGELATLTLLAIPPGLLMGYGLSWLASLPLQTDVYRIPLVIYPATYTSAAVVVLLAAAVSGLIVRRRLDRLDLFAVLKGSE